MVEEQSHSLLIQPENPFPFTLTHSPQKSTKDRL